MDIMHLGSSVSVLSVSSLDIPQKRMHTDDGSP